MKLYQPVYDPAYGILNPAGYGIIEHDVPEITPADTFGKDYGIQYIRLRNKETRAQYNIVKTSCLYTTRQAAEDYINKKWCPPTLYAELLEQRRAEYMKEVSA